MKVQLVSDLHLECYFDEGEAFVHKDLQVAADVLVLAGDVMNLTSNKHVLEVLTWFCDRWPHVIYVPGNHEYYLTSPDEGNARLCKAEQKLPNLTVLNPGFQEVGGQRFVGATMWFPLTPNEDKYRRWLSDFTHIREFLPWVHEQHEEEIKFLEWNVQPTDVVITHHMPHPNSTPPRFQGQPTNRFFVAPDASRVLAKDPKLWLHVHTHDGCDYTVGKTRVVCNPRGYPGEKYKKPVDLALVIDTGI